jgi:predicted ArsR family transcriptional regulator
LNPIEIFRKKFETYRKVLDEAGEQQAWDVLFDGYPERQRKNMSRIETASLVDAFSEAIETYKQIGMEMDVYDISNNGKDAVIEVQKICPAMDIAKEFGFDKPCKVICEMDMAATQIAFADQNMQISILCRQADGDCVCIFKYERPLK